MSKLKSTKGFTLIELVIVLAIAALILAGVLIAVGGAQRSQRDTARKNIAGRVASAISNYQSNNDGKTSGFTCTTSSYCGGINDPDSGAPPITGTTPDSSNGVEWDLGKDCAGNASNRAFRVYYFVESNGSVGCKDNS